MPTSFINSGILYLRDDLVTASLQVVNTKTIMLMTHRCHQFMAVHQYDCVLNIAQCHQFFMFKQVSIGYWFLFCT